MMENSNSFSSRAQKFRMEFDASFSEPARVNDHTIEDLIRLVVAGDCYAFRVGEIAGLLADKKVLRLPGETSVFLGIAGFRGDIVPVYSLRGLLGYEPGPPGRWLVIARANSTFGVEFDHFEGHLRVASADIVSAQSHESSLRHIHSVAQLGISALPIISLSAVFDTISQRSDVLSTKKEKQ